MITVALLTTAPDSKQPSVRQQGVKKELTGSPFSGAPLGSEEEQRTGMQRGGGASVTQSGGRGQRTVLAERSPV